MHKFNEMEKKFQKNKTFDKDQSESKEDLNKDKNIKFETLKLKESDYIKFKKKQMIKENEYLKQKSGLYRKR